MTPMTETSAQIRLTLRPSSSFFVCVWLGENSIYLPTPLGSTGCESVLRTPPKVPPYWEHARNLTAELTWSTLDLSFYRLVCERVTLRN